jgi:monofunctional biosynthetic peptidoglycan transglycosylase
LPIIKLVNRKKKQSFIAKARRAVVVIVVSFMVASVVISAILRWLPPPTSAFMLYRHYEDLLDSVSFKPISYRWVSNNHISPYAGAAAMAAEDQRFPDHGGFDFDSIESSIDKYRKGGKLRGASTISQQVAKNLFLTPTRNFLRKGLEAWFTLLIELLWSKERILEVYLNIAEFGDHIFGVEAASQRYFKIPASKLNRSQAALLAASLPNPIKLKVSQPSAYLVRRQAWIMRQMSNLADLQL